LPIKPDVAHCRINKSTESDGNREAKSWCRHVTIATAIHDKRSRRFTKCTRNIVHVRDPLFDRNNCEKYAKWLDYDPISGKERRCGFCKRPD